MENQPTENCQTCFKPTTEVGSNDQTQWVTVCRCNRPYTPNSQFSIDVCANCKTRIPTITSKVRHPQLCSCATPAPRKVPTYLKQNEKDSLEFDITDFDLSSDAFPLERYAPLALLGNTARATVLLCRDRQRGTKVAVKCFKKIDPKMQSTFDGEVRKNKQLNHTNIAKIVDASFNNGKAPYVVSEYKDGFNIEQSLAIHGTPSADVAVKILLAVCEAIQYAQKQGVNHGDIRPGNIIFLDDANSEPAICLTDFSLPKVKAGEQLTEAMEAMYISADEARGLDFSEKSEVYTLGSVGFALLTGQPPFPDGTALDIKNKHALKLPPKISSIKFDPNRPADLEEVIEKCLEKDPKDRFESIAKLKERLEVFPRREQQKIAAILRERKKKKILRVAVIVLIAAALGGIGFLTYGAH